MTNEEAKKMGATHYHVVGGVTYYHKDGFVLLMGKWCELPKWITIDLFKPL